MAANYVLLEKITVGSAGASSVTFNSIPQTGYTDLVVKTSIRQTSNSNRQPFSLRFNGSTTNYSSRMVQGEGGTGSVASYTNVFGITNGLPLGASPTAGQTANTFSNGEFYIPNYTSSNFKSVSADNSSETNTTTDFQWAEWLTAGLWSDTSAITSISLLAYSGDSFAQYSTFYLYGVAKLGTTPAIQPYATGGDTIMTDGTYWYHTFISSGTFTPAKSLSCDYLVVAGGGGGAADIGGGGAAGGLRCTVTATGGGGSLETPLSLGTSAYTVTIGAGGAGGSANNRGTDGNNSVFASITSTAGGSGGSAAGAAANQKGNNGGSGGGGGGSVSGPKGTGTANQGYAGGDGSSGSASPYYGAGGGGGAGAVGGNGTTTNGGNGGNGVATSISGSSVTYAGGGGAGCYTGGTKGTGGTGGGGSGDNVGGGTGATAGTANTGGGGGGGSSSGSIGKAGGSGIVIVRYAV